MALHFGYQTVSWFWYPEEYTVFQTLEEIRSAGFGGVELNEDLKRLGTPEIVTRDLGTLGMQCCGISSVEHMIAIKQQMADWKNRIIFAGKMGLKVVPISLGWRETGDPINDASYKTLGKNLEELAAEATKAGVTLAFAPRYATLVETAADLERLLPYAPSIKLCADMVNLAVCGDDPVEFVQRYRGEIIYTRIGDWRIHKLVPLGKGFPLRRHETWSGTASTEIEDGAPVVPTLDVPRFLGALEEIGYDGWVVVSQGTTDPEYSPRQAANISREFLRKLGY